MALSGSRAARAHARSTQPVRTSEALSDAARTVIEDRSQQLHVSAASAWEIATKRRQGKLPQADALVVGYERNLERLTVHELSVTSSHAILAGQLEWSHRDPFDRMMAAQAMLERFTLVTNDSVFTTLPAVRTLW